LAPEKHFPVTFLVHMTQDKFLAFAEEAVPTFEAEKVAAGLWPPDEALELSHKSFNELLPQV
jgi:hypothetical protein